MAEVQDQLIVKSLTMKALMALLIENGIKNATGEDVTISIEDLTFLTVNDTAVLHINSHITMDKNEFDILVRKIMTGG